MSNLIKFPGPKKTDKEIYEEAMRRYWERENQLQKERYAAFFLAIACVVLICVLLWKYGRYMV